MNYRVSMRCVLCIVLVSLTIGAVLGMVASSAYRSATHLGRDLNQLQSQLKLGMRQADVIEALGSPATITGSTGDLVPYRVSAPERENMMLYAEYPWGIVVYVDEKQRVSRLLLVRAP